MEKRFYFDRKNLSENTIILDGEEFNHLSKVLRLKVNDEIEAFFDNSKIFKCQIEQINKNNAVLKVKTQYDCTQNPSCEICLFQALPKLDKLELVTQKLSEIGITRIVPFTSKFCIAKENQNKIERLNKIAISSCKQCGRTQIIQISTVQTFDQMLSKIKDYDLTIFANETETEFDKNSLEKIFSLVNNMKKVAYIIGSEGGFSPEEVEKIKSTGAKSISLGKRILRTETASIALGALISHLMGEI